MKMQSSRWTFFDYADGNGVNKISEWLRSIPSEARVEFEALLDVIKVKQILDEPQTKMLKGGCRGLYEFRFKAHNLQYRPLFIYGPGRGEITILIGATKKSNRFIPPSACRIALNRAGEVRANTKRVVHHVRIG